MKKLQVFSTLKNVKVLNNKEITNIKGGLGWGNSGDSNGHGCPPPFEG